ncbi:hypothetical protein ACLBOM_07075 [Escherichia coli]
MLVASKIAEAFPQAGGHAHGCGARAHLTVRYLAPDPVAARDKLREPRSGDFVRQSLGCRARRLAAPARSLRQ